MKIRFTGSSYSHPEAIAGHLYKNSDDDEALYFCVDRSWELRLFRLSNGNIWDTESTFGEADPRWTDVTNDFVIIEEKGVTK